VALVLTGCTHSEPYSTEPPDPLGPPSAALPRQLTFTPGDDRAPNLSGPWVAYHRLEPESAFPAPCIGILPAEGGTLNAEYCAPPPSPADTFVSSWLEPALSPDGTQLAFVWRRSSRVSTMAAWSYDLVVADVDSPAVPRATLSLWRLLPGDRLVNTAMELSWAGSARIRFIAAYDSVFKVKGGGAIRFTDTVTVPRALMEFDISTDTVRVLAGADNVVAWAPAADGSPLVVPDSNPRLVLAVGGDGARTLAAAFPERVTDLALSAGWLAATGSADSVLVPVGPDTFAWRYDVVLDSLYWLEPVSGQRGVLGLPGLARRLAPGADGHVVVEVERPGGDEFGAPANLWLYPLPTGTAVR